VCPCNHCCRGKAVSITHPDCYNLTQLITRFAFLNLSESKCSKQRNTNFINNSTLYYFYYFTIIRIYICLVVCMRLSKVYPLLASVSRTPLISWVGNRIHQLYCDDNSMTPAPPAKLDYERSQINLQLPTTSTTLLSFGIRDLAAPKPKSIHTTFKQAEAIYEYQLRYHLGVAPFQLVLLLKLCFR